MKYVILLFLLGSTSGRPGYLDRVAHSLYSYGYDVVNSVGESIGLDLGADRQDYYDRYSNGSVELEESFWNNPLEKTYNYILNYSPVSVKRFINASLDEGSELVYELKSDLQLSVKNQTEEHVEKLRELGLETYRGLEDIFYTVNEIMRNGGGVSAEKLQREQDHLKELEKYLTDLEIEIYNSTASNNDDASDQEEDEVQIKIKELIETVRSFLLGDLDEIESGIWTRVDRLKLQSVRTRAIVVSSLGQLSEILSNILESIDMMDEKENADSDEDDSDDEKMAENDTEDDDGNEDDYSGDDEDSS